jgi:hypothetical protein
MCNIYLVCLYLLMPPLFVDYLLDCPIPLFSTAIFCRRVFLAWNVFFPDSDTILN